MEYVKGKPYFCQGTQIKQYPYLDRDIKTDVLIVGGGIDGAIANFYLSQRYDCCLVEKSRLGYGCTSCSTVLLEYQLDDFAHALPMSESETVEVYKMGLKSIDKIEDFIKKHGNLCDFRKTPSFLYTTENPKNIEQEFLFRLKNGFEAEIFYKNDNPFPFEISCGLFCEDGGAEFNPYLFTKQMIDASPNQENIFENTEIEKIDENKHGFCVFTNFGYKISCKKIVLATGFNFKLMREKNLCKKFVSYTIVTNKIKNLEFYHNALVQDDMSPYHYFRLLPDNRIIFGGEDTPAKHIINEKLSLKKYNDLLSALNTALTQYADKIQIDYKFCGAFGTTENNLGLIGKSENPNIYYLLSCGANGVINAMYGVELLAELFENKTPPLANLFSPLRQD